MKITLEKFKLHSQVLDLYLSKIRKIPWKLGMNAFWFILIIILLEILFGEFLFYKHVILKNTEEPEIINVSTKFRENTYESVLKEMKQREDILKNMTQKEYESPFR